MKKKKKNVKKILLIIIIIILVLIGAMIGNVMANGGGFQGLLFTLLGENKNKIEDLEEIQVLIIGESGVDEYKLADTIMVASYDPKTQKASLLSIPRDTYVGSKDINKASTNYLASWKINSVYRNGKNMEEFIQKVNELTNLNLDKYVIVNTKALRELVDVIGGVNFNVPRDMKYTDETQNLYIDLKAGWQLLNGKQAEQLVRFRKNDDGSTYSSEYGQNDFGRMRTQREFLTEIAKQTITTKNLFKIGSIADIIFNNVKKSDNIDLDSIKNYLPYLIEFNTENIQAEAYPSESIFVNNVWIIKPKNKEAQEILNRFYVKNNTENKIENEVIID